MVWCFEEMFDYDGLSNGGGEWDPSDADAQASRLPDNHRDDGRTPGTTIRDLEPNDVEQTPSWTWRCLGCDSSECCWTISGWRCSACDGSDFYKTNGPAKKVNSQGTWVFTQVIPVSMLLPVSSHRLRPDAGVVGNTQGTLMMLEMVVRGVSQKPQPMTRRWIQIVRYLNLDLPELFKIHSYLDVKDNSEPYYQTELQDWQHHQTMIGCYML